MARARGFWLRDQMSFLLGAWGSSTGTWVSFLGTGEAVEGAGATALLSNWRAVVENDRWVRRASPRADRMLVVDIMLGCNVRDVRVRRRRGLGSNRKLRACRSRGTSVLYD